ncbi:hypothetical protein FXO38_30917 [Capsicum annuum]|nr:hypothetical protein FXO38_30917 [Capsicum annuum]
MKQKHKKSTQSLLASLRGRQTDNHNIIVQDLDQQDDHVVNENMTTPTLSDGNIISSSNSNEASLKVNEEPLLVKIKAGVDWVMHSLRNRWRSFKYKLQNNFYPYKSKEDLLEKTPKNVDFVVDWTAFVHHCNEEKTKDKILEHLPEDQELAISYGVPLKILAHPNDVIEKVYGSENFGHVHGLDGNVCPSKAFGISRNSHVNLVSSSSISSQRVEDLEKQVETLNEKLTGYEETKEKFVQMRITWQLFIGFYKLNLVASCLL